MDWMLLPSLILLAFALVQMAFVLRYCHAIKTRLQLSSQRDYQPEATIVLCLRGTDPYLKDCIRSLLGQSYETFHVLCVFDNQVDPAWQVVEPFSKDSRLSMLVAQPGSGRCSLKCNSLVQAFGQIQTTVAVLVDADAVVDKHWLADLVAPLAEDGVVAASGNRWFVPESPDQGTRVRYLWNLAAAPQMYAYRIAWGGSLALKTDFVRDSGLLDFWATSLFEDTSVPRVAQRHGGQVAMIPELLIPNRESIRLSGACRWIERQLLDTRLYHSRFPLVLIHCFGVALILLATLVTTAVLFTQAKVLYGLISLSLVLAYACFYAWSWKALDDCAHQALQRRGYEFSRVARDWQGWLAVLLTQVVYTYAAWRAVISKRVRWRGIEYRIHGPFDVEMQDYAPMTGRMRHETESI